MSVCLLCGEIIGREERSSSTTALLADGTWQRARMHDECALRNVMGGWGHITDHEFWCNTIGDTDGGLTRRESARRVAAWVRENRVPE
jgi:hypothetical protein